MRILRRQRRSLDVLLMWSWSLCHRLAGSVGCSCSSITVSAAATAVAAVHITTTPVMASLVLPDVVGRHEEVQQQNATSTTAAKTADAGSAPVTTAAVITIVRDVQQILSTTTSSSLPAATTTAKSYPTTEGLRAAVTASSDHPASSSSSTAATTEDTGAATPSAGVPTSTDEDDREVLFSYPPKSIHASDWLRHRDRDERGTTTTLITLPPTLQELRTWSFDPLLYEAAALDSVFQTILQSYQLETRYNIPTSVLAAFSAEVRHRHRDVIYHNWFHIISVLHMTFMFLEDGGAATLLQEDDILAVLVSAYIHDLEHPGHNNDYENAMDSTCSQKYQQQSVLENHSLEIAFQHILSQPQWNIFQNYDHAGQEDVEPSALQQEITDIVLRTDIARYHGDVATKLQQFKQEAEQEYDATAQTAAGGVAGAVDGSRRKMAYFDKTKPAHRRMLCQVIIKAADIANPILPNRPAVQDWALRISTEFTQQVTQEKAYQLPYNPRMELHTEYDVAQGQVGFYTHMAIPYFQVLCDVLPNNLQYLLENAQQNLHYYQQYIQYVDTRNANANKEEEED